MTVDDIRTIIDERFGNLIEGIVGFQCVEFIHRERKSLQRIKC